MKNAQAQKNVNKIREEIVKNPTMSPTHLMTRIFSFICGLFFIACCIVSLGLLGTTLASIYLYGASAEQINKNITLIVLAGISIWIIFKLIEAMYHATRDEKMLAHFIKKSLLLKSYDPISEEFGLSSRTLNSLETYPEESIIDGKKLLFYFSQTAAILAVFFQIIGQLSLYKFNWVLPVFTTDFKFDPSISLPALTLLVIIIGFNQQLKSLLDSTKLTPMKKAWNNALKEAQSLKKYIEKNHRSKVHQKFILAKEIDCTVIEEARISTFSRSFDHIIELAPGYRVVILENFALANRIKLMSAWKKLQHLIYIGF